MLLPKQFAKMMKLKRLNPNGTTADLRARDCQTAPLIRTGVCIIRHPIILPQATKGILSFAVNGG
jgi:hypothetical protein